MIGIYDLLYLELSNTCGMSVSEYVSRIEWLITRDEDTAKTIIDTLVCSEVGVTRENTVKQFIKLTNNYNN